MNHLLCIGDHFVAAVERAEQLVDVADAASTAFQQVEDGSALAGGSVVERHHPVSAVPVERAQDADARVAFVAVESDGFVVV